jgi:hypothetical protein
VLRDEATNSAGNFTITVNGTICPPPAEGDNCNNPFVITGSLPATLAGDTTGFIDEYDATGPYQSPGGPDVVYSYTPTSTGLVSVDLCASSYDTKLYVYQGVCTGTPIACSDDQCGSDGFKSKVYCVPMTAGTTYYIVVDGYDAASFGPYVLTLSTCVACGSQVTNVANQPTGSPASNYNEGEACGADSNGGCNATPPAFENIARNQVVFGTVWADADSRDTDWYQFTTSAAGTATISLWAEVPTSALLLQGDCATPDAIVVLAEADADCSAPALNISATVTASTTYWLFVGTGISTGAIYDGFPCTYPSGTQYKVRLVTP